MTVVILIYERNVLFVTLKRPFQIFSVICSYVETKKATDSFLYCVIYAIKMLVIVTKKFG